MTDPTDALCPPLEGNLGDWQSPQQFIDRHARIWRYKADPANFNAGVFTGNCLLVDPTGTIKGNVAAAESFQKLFATTSIAVWPTARPNPRPA